MIWLDEGDVDSDISAIPLEPEKESSYANHES